MSGLFARSRLATVMWTLGAALAVLSVLVLNGRPLFYFDTPGYVDQGRLALEQLGLVAKPAAATAGQGGAAVVEAVKTVDGSRSPFYSFLAGLFAHFGALEGLLVVNLTGLALVLWLLARAAGRVLVPDMSRAALVAAPVMLAALGSLPFYAAYLMPDMFAPVMILALALVTAFGRAMLAWELVLAFLVASVAIVSHLSHFAIAGLLLLATLLVGPLTGGRRWWIGPAVALAVLGAAYGQQAAFRAVAAKAAHSDVVIKPFITARLIQDGPGLDYLAGHCPDPAIATCALYTALQRSDDPYRLTASHIIFEDSERLGSFRLMTPADQKAVADAQRGFFLAVLKDRPLATAMAFLKNTVIQSAKISIDMTLPTDNVVERNAGVTGALTGPLVKGRLDGAAPWVDRYVVGQGVLYILSLAVVLWLAVRPGTSQAVRGFAAMIILGILANALVCGGISQPATRYGARVIWLLPFLAGFMMLMTLGGDRDKAR